MDYEKFFSRKSEIVARELIGKQILRTANNGSVSCMIAETGAYEGGNINDSRKGMLYVPGTLFLMPFRAYKLLNIATDREGFPSCVEIRRIQLIDKQIKGPGSISKFLGLEGLDGMLLGNEVQILDNTNLANPMVIKSDGKSENCLGYFSLASEVKE